MTNLALRISTLLCFNLFVFGCDVDDEMRGLGDAESFADEERDAPLADERDEPRAAPLDDERDEPRGAPGGDDLAVGGGRHCTVEATVVPEGVDPASVRSADGKVTCFPSFAEAIFSVTGERLAADATPDSYEPVATLTSEAPGPQRASYVAGVEYQYDNWGGASLTVHASRTCLTTGAITTNLTGSWWDNRITSAKAYSGCQHSYHYEMAYQNDNGAVKDCHTSCWYVGDALQNRTSSLRWTK